MIDTKFRVGAADAKAKVAVTSGCASTPTEEAPCWRRDPPPCQCWLRVVVLPLHGFTRESGHVSPKDSVIAFFSSLVSSIRVLQTFPLFERDIQEAKFICMALQEKVHVVKTICFEATRKHKFISTRVINLFGEMCVFECGAWSSRERICKSFVLLERHGIVHPWSFTGNMFKPVPARTIPAVGVTSRGPSPPASKQAPAAQRPKPQKKTDGKIGDHSRV